MVGYQSLESSWRAWSHGIYGPTFIPSYHVETGGKLKNLRESTTIEKVRAYHKSYYRPENLYLIITGNIGSEDILSALEPVEEKILRKRSRGETPLPLEKPFQRDLPKLEENVTQTFQYPAEDLLFGKVRPGLVWQQKTITTDGTS